MQPATTSHVPQQLDVARPVLIETVDHDAGDFDLHEWRSAAASLEASGYCVTRFTQGDMLSGDVKLCRGTPVVGSRTSLSFALRSLHVIGPSAPLPERSDYPSALNWFLGRNIWPSTLGEAMAMAAGAPVFVKPRGAENVKLFTGFVVDESNAWRLHNLPPDLRVWCSEVLSFVSEWRCYVLRGSVKLVCYSGDEHLAPPDTEAIRKAIDALKVSGEGSAAYALDVGVGLVKGSPQTALIEVNDGFSLGLYPGCPESWYAAMNIARWDEMAGAADRG